jgi:hypothetical protein
MFGITDPRITIRRLRGALARRVGRSESPPRLVAYTAIFGGRDSLKDPTVITPHCRYVCFTDEPLVSEIWEIVRVPAPTDPRRARPTRASGTVWATHEKFVTRWAGIAGRAFRDTPGSGTVACCCAGIRR